MADEITLTVTLKGAVKSGRLTINDVKAPLTGSGSSFKSSVKLNATVKRVKIAWGVRGTNGTKVELVAKAGLLTSVFVAAPPTGPPPPGTQEDWVTVQFFYERAEHSVFSGTKSFDSQVTTKTFNGLGGTVGYAREIAGAFSLGTTFGVRRKTNYDDLKSVEVSTQRLFVDPSTGATRLVQSGKNSAKEGTYVSGNVVQWRNEAFFYPGMKPRVGFGGYHNSNFSDERLLKRTDLGLTVALLQLDSPSTSLAAMVFEFRDVTDAQDSHKSIKDRFVLSVQASVPIAPKFGW